MEIAEWHRSPLITVSRLARIGAGTTDYGQLQMLRRGNLLFTNSNHSVEPKLEDLPDVVDEKWRSWISHESYKR